MLNLRILTLTTGHLLSLCIVNLTAQVPTQEQCLQADAQLNQVYQQLRASLNDAQKQQLKQAQRDWIKQRDAFVAANPGNPQGALYQATVQRVAELSGILNRSAIIQTTQQGKRSASGSQQVTETEAAQEVSTEDDAELNAVYLQLKQNLDESQKEILKRSQREWLKFRDGKIKSDGSNQQAAASNIKQIIQSRIKDFRELYNAIGNKFEKEISIQTIKRLGQYNYSYPYLIKLASNGDPYAQGLEAINIYGENGRDKNIPVAVKYATESFKSGNPFGKYIYGKMIQDGIVKDNNYGNGLQLQAEAFSELLKLSSEPIKFADLCFDHNIDYIDKGVHYVKNTAQGNMSFQEWNKLMDDVRGYPPAIMAVADLINRKVVTDDESRALKYIRCAALMGYPPAEYNYAQTTKVNPDERKKLISKAAKAGYKPAIEYIKNNTEFLAMGKGYNDILKRYNRKTYTGKVNEIAAQINIGHSEEPVVATISENGLIVATGTVQGDIIIWDLITGKVCRNISIGMRLGGMRFISDNVIMVIGGEYKTFEQDIKFFDTSDGKQLGEALRTSINGNYASAYRPSDFSIETGLIAGVGEKKTLEVIGLNSFSANEKPRNDDSDYTTIPIPSLGDLEYPVRCSFIDQGKRIEVKIAKYNVHREDVLDLSVNPWDTSAVETKLVGSIIYDLNSKKWGDLHYEKYYTSSAVLAYVNDLTILKDGKSLFFVKKDSNTVDTNINLKQGSVVSKFACNKEGNKIFLRNAIFDFSTMNLKSLTSDFPCDEILRISFLNDDTLFYSLSDSSYHKYSLKNGFSKKTIPSDNRNSGRFAIADNAGLIIDSSGAVYDYNGNKMHSFLSLTNRPFLTVSCSSDASTIAFGDHFNAMLFRKNGGSYMQYSIKPQEHNIDAYPDFASVSDDGKCIIFSGNHRSNGAAIYFDTNNNITPLPFNTSLNGFATDRSLLSANCISDRHAILYSSSSFDVFNLNSKSPISTWDSGERSVDTWSNAYYFAYPFHWAVSLLSKRIYYYRSNGLIEIIDISQLSNPRKVAWLYFDSSSALALVTTDNYYIGSGGVFSFIHFVSRDNHVFPFEQFDLRLNRPDIVLERLGAPKEAIETAKSLREKRLKRMGVTEEMLKPDFHLPELQIEGDIPATTAKDQLDLQIKATDDKYPLDRLRVYVNNVPVNGRDGELLRDQKTQSLEKAIPIKLAAGRNKIQVSVLNSAGAESLYANAEVNCSAERPKPKLYAVALGVSQYDRPEWCLKYAAKDATDLIGKLKEKAGSSYSEVKPLLLTDKEVTKESAAKIKEFLSTATIDDTVLIFMAGHGLLDDKYDYYFGTSDIDPAKPSERGMPYEAIDTILAEVPSLKKALLMDTCHAGELDDDEKKDLAASDASATPAGVPVANTNSSPLAGKVAMRAIGTRGMQVKAIQGAKGKSDWYEKLQDMFVDLRRGSGATVISSSQGAEYAFESSEQSNGLFTYSLMEALDGKATPNKDGQITISTVGDYVKKRVQDLTKGKQNPNLRGVNLEEDFVLGTAK